MKFCRLAKYDLLCGIWHRFYQYLLMFPLGFVFCGSFYMRLSAPEIAIPDAGETPSIINVLFYLFAGRDAFSPSAENKFVFPVVWLLIFLYASYLSLEYPYKSLSVQETQIMLRIESRNTWWFSKCFWVLVSTCAVFGILYLSVLFSCVVFKIDISFQYSELINTDLLQMDIEPLRSGQLVMLLLVLPFMTSLCINTIQLCIGLFVKKIYAFMISALILCASCYFQFFGAIGSYAMVKRSVFCSGGQVSISQGLWGNGMIILIMVAVGLWRFRRYNILREE